MRQQRHACLRPNGPRRPNVTEGARDPNEIERDPRVTRVGDVRQHAGFDLGFQPQLDPTERQLDELEGLAPLSYSPALAAGVLEAMLATLPSAKQGRRVELPLSEEDPIYELAWPVS